MLQEGRERNDREKVSASFFLCYISLKGEVEEGKKKPCSPQKTCSVSGHIPCPMDRKDSHGRLYDRVYYIYRVSDEIPEQARTHNALQSFREMCLSRLTYRCGLVIGIVN